MPTASPAPWIALALVAAAACQTADTPRVSQTPQVSDEAKSAARADVAQRQAAGAVPPTRAKETSAVPAPTVPDPIAVPSDVAAIPRDAKRTDSGLAYRVLQKGAGTQHPTRHSQVQVHYSGWTTDGKRFDSSVARGSPVKFGLSQLIPGWTEGLQLMVEGDKWRLWVPSALAYNDAPGMPTGMLVFDVELLKIF